MPLLYSKNMQSNGRNLKINDMENNIKILFNNFITLEKSIKYSFNNKSNLLLALTHSSFANENKKLKLYSNERLEFLGDAVLNMVISEKIFLDYPDLNEGEMTKIRAAIVCETSLAKYANKINLAEYLLLSKGEELTGGRSRPSILADVFEALIGAIYIDGGINKAKKFINNVMRNAIDEIIENQEDPDYKTHFQEIIQRKGEDKIQYEVIEEKGPDHDKIFVTQLKVNEKVMGKGRGKSKKAAEQNAAKDALERM